MTMKKTFYSTVFLLGSLIAVCGQATLINFNGGGELASDFAGFTDFSQSGTGGLAGSGSITLTANSQIAVHQTAFDASALSNSNFGAYFQYNGAAGSGRPFAIGFTSGASDTYNTSSTTTGSDIRVALNGQGDGNYGLDILNSGGTVVISSKDIALVNSNWYYLQLTIGGVSGGNFTGVTAELFNSDNSGVLGGSLKLLNDAGSGYSVASALTSDTTAYGFFGGQNPTTRGIAAVDNFTTATPVPEPSTYAMIVGLFVLGFAWFRKRKM